MTQFPSMSPYEAFNDNPVLFIDPYGLESKTGPRFRKSEIRFHIGRINITIYLRKYWRMSRKGNRFPIGIDISKVPRSGSKTKKSKYGSSKGNTDDSSSDNNDNKNKHRLISGWHISIEPKELEVDIEFGLFKKWDWENAKQYVVQIPINTGVTFKTEENYGGKFKVAYNTHGTPP